jgi:hypothetical protein
MILPFPVLLRSQIQKRKKGALLGLLTLGTFITIIQVLRIRTIKSLANYLDSASLIMWSTVENNLGIIVASIPTLAPLIKYFAEKVQRSSNASSSNNSKSPYVHKTTRGTSLGPLPFGNSSRRDTHIRGPSGGGSEEFILGDITAITKKTEVTVEAYDRSGSRETDD